MNDPGYTKFTLDTLNHIKNSVSEATAVLSRTGDVNEILQGRCMSLEPSGQSDSTFESSHVGSLSFGDDPGIEDIKNIKSLVNPVNDVEVRLGAIQVRVCECVTCTETGYILFWGFIVRRTLE